MLRFGGKKITALNRHPFNILNEEGNTPEAVIDSKRELLSYLIEEGKKGINVQRYKGLGEMNPEQLWETTMNPEKTGTSSGEGGGYRRFG